MTDSNLPDDVTPLPDRPRIPEEPDDGSGERTPAGEDTPGSPTTPTHELASTPRVCKCALRSPAR